MFIGGGFSAKKNRLQALSSDEHPMTSLLRKWLIGIAVTFKQFFYYFETNSLTTQDTLLNFEKKLVQLNRTP